MVDLVPNARQQFVDANGAPLVGGFVYMYIPNTTIPKITYQDQAGTIPNSNPLVLDDLGSAAIWGFGLYRQVVTDSLGNLIWDALTNPPGELINSGTNAGVVVWFASSTPPNGFLECDGSAVSRTTYNLLFQAIGTTWGVGDGMTTFNLPDLRGQFIRAWDDGAGVDPGRAFGSNQIDGVNESDITLDSSSLVVSGDAEGTLALPGTLNGGEGSASGGQNTSSTGTNDLVVGSGTLDLVATITGSITVNAQDETRPVNVALLPCISTGVGAGNSNGGTVVLGLTQVTNADSPYTLLPTDTLVLCDSMSGAITINPPGIPVPGQLIWVKDQTGQAGTHAITLEFTIDAEVDPTLSSPYDARQFVNNGSGWSFLS